MSRFNLEDDEPKIHGTCTKSQLASMYNISIQTLSKWLNEDLLDKLTDTGYSKNQSILTPKQLQIIYDRYGKP